MSNFFHNLILDEEQQDETFDYIDISFPFSDEFHRLLTYDQYDDIEAYYLFNKVKIWQKKVNDKNENKKNKMLMFLIHIISVLIIFLCISLGILYSIHENEIENINSISISTEQPVIKFKELTIKEKFKSLLKVIL